MKEQRTSVSGGHLWSVCQGTGPAIILCHGGPGLWDYLAPVAEMIADLAAVYRYDQRGCGRSSGGPPWTLDQALDDMEAVRRDWKVQQWLVIGHSFGASLALAYGVRFPQHVQGIGYISGTGIDPTWHAVYHQERRRRYTDAEFAELEWSKQQYLQAGELERHRAFRDYAERLWTSDVANQPQASRLLEGMLNSPWLPNEDANRALGQDVDRFMENSQMREQLQRLAIPTWILHGMADPRPITSVQHLAELLPQSQFVALSDCGHLPWVEQPELFRTSIRQFITSL